MKTLKESLLDNIETTLNKDTAIEEILKTLLSADITISKNKYIELLEIIKEKCEVIDVSEVEEFCEINNPYWSIRDSWCTKEFFKREKPHLKKNDWALIIDKQCQFDSSKNVELWIGKLDDTSRCHHICVYTWNGVDRGYMQKSNTNFFGEFKRNHIVYVLPKSLKKIVTDCVKTYKERNYDYYNK